MASCSVWNSEMGDSNSSSYQSMDKHVSTVQSPTRTV